MVNMESTKSKAEITTIKLQKNTKDRIDHLKVYKRESYDEIIQKMLNVLNLCKVNPVEARKRLMLIDREKKLSSY